MDVKLIKKVVEKEEKKFVNFYLQADGVSRLIPIKACYPDSKSDFAILNFLAERN